MNVIIPRIILAAGSSSRLGRPKQTVAFRGQTLLEHTIGVAMATNIPGKTILVYGEEDYSDNRLQKRILAVPNAQWKLGMGRSIAVGVEMMMREAPEADGVIIMLCDQPFVHVEVLRQLAEKGIETQGIVVSDYGLASGPPCYFNKKYFLELGGLSGDAGAKAIVQAHKSEVVSIPFPEGKIDIDTTEDLKYLKA